MNEKNVLYDIFEIVKNDKTKIGQKVYNNILDKDFISAVIVNNNIFYIEKTSIYNSIPDYFYKYIKKIMSKKGYKYLYDI